MFGAPRNGGPPCIHENDLFVEGTVAAHFSSLKNKIDQYLTWGAAFTTFAQKSGMRAVESAAYLALVVVLKTDIRKAPKSFSKISRFVR